MRIWSGLAWAVLKDVAKMIFGKRFQFSWKRNPLPRWAGWPGKGGLLVAVGAILIFTGLRPVLAGGINGNTPSNSEAAPRERLVATAQSPEEVVSDLQIKASPTPFQPAEQSLIQEMLRPQVTQPTSMPVYVPDFISVPVIQLQARIIPVGADTVEIDGSLFQQWKVLAERR